MWNKLKKVILCEFNIHNLYHLISFIKKCNNKVRNVNEILNDWSYYVSSFADMLLKNKNKILEKILVIKYENITLKIGIKYIII